MNASTEQPLENNDIISFGFNTASVYDINDKNAFIYRLVKESIETIDLSDDDDEGDRPAAAVAAAPPLPSATAAAQPNARIISIENKVIDIGSDSDSEYSGDECLQDIEEMDGSNSSSLSSVGESSDMFDDENSSSNLSMDSDDMYNQNVHEGNFVVTKTILNCETPTETISLDTSADESSNDGVNHDNNDATANIVTVDLEASQQNTALEQTPASTSTQVEEKEEEKEKEKSKDQDEETDAGEQKTNGENDILVVTSTAEVPTETVADDGIQAKDTETPKNDEQIDKNDTIKPTTTTTTNDDQNKLLAARLDVVKRRVAENIPKTMNMIKAQPLRKRRRTLTESEYIRHKEHKHQKVTDMKRLRKEKLADIAAKKSAAAAAAAVAAAGTEAAEGAAPGLDGAEISNERIPFVPKVKNVTVSRGEQLLTDMMAFNPSNI